MRITVLLFARLRDLVGNSEVALDVADGSQVSDVWRLLEKNHPGIAPYSRSVSAAVNADFAQMDTRIAEGDEVAFLPPVSGG